MFYPKLILLFSCLLMVTNMYAESELSLVVLLKSGTQINLPVSEQPKITFDGTVMRVGNGDYQIENVRKWMIGDPQEIEQGIEDAQTQKSIVYKDGVLTVNSSADIHVYNAAGIEMPVSTRRQSDGQQRVDFSSLPKDVYLVKVGNETLKIRKP